MIKKLFLDKIDRLLVEQSELRMKKEKLKNKIQSKNSKIETKIQNWEYKAFANREMLETKNAEFDRKLEKIKDQIALERKYNQNISKPTKKGKK